MGTKRVVKNEDLDVLADYVRRRILANHSDPETDTEYPGVWKAIINVLRASGRWDEKECFPTPERVNPKCKCCGRDS